tara:strand:+ start:845 stop:1057 length:213 start_codon:yes stop_codon:yes gene_type:complete
MKETTLTNLIHQYKLYDVVPVHVLNQFVEKEQKQLIEAFIAGEDNIDDEGLYIVENGAVVYFDNTYGDVL